MTNKEKSQLQKQVLDSIDSFISGRLLLAPRVGKTKLIIDLIKRDKPKSILWVSLSEKLLIEDIPAEFKTWKALRFIPKLQTSTWASLNKVKGNFDLIVLDEDQHLTENNAVNLLDSSLSGRIISMTGTDSKDTSKINLYKQLRLRTLYEISINEAVDIGLLSDYKINVIQVPMGTKKNFLAGNQKKRFYTTEEANYKYINEDAEEAFGRQREFKMMNRMRVIKNSPAKLGAAKYVVNSLKGRRLIFCAGIKQSEEICDHVYHSKSTNEDLNKFQRGDVDRIAMVNSGGTGFTYKKIDHLVIVQADSDRNGSTSQKITRTLLKQKDYKANVWIICLMGTQDENWVESTLNAFDRNKVEYINFKNLIL